MYAYACNNHLHALWCLKASVKAFLSVSCCGTAAFLRHSCCSSSACRCVPSTTCIYAGWKALTLLLLLFFIVIITQGGLDGGLDIPHGDKRFCGYDTEAKKLDTEQLKKYILGGHVSPCVLSSVHVTYYVGALKQAKYNLFGAMLLLGCSLRKHKRGTYHKSPGKQHLKAIACQVA